MDNEYRLNAAQAEFCCSVLVKELVEISAQLARGASEEESHLSVSSGESNTASGESSSVSAGNSNTAGGFNTVVIGGNGVTDNNDDSIAPQPPFP